MLKKSIFLLTENDFNSENLQLIHDTKNAIIIPLTFKTIKFLKENKIEFELFDDLISPKDYEDIDNTIYNIGRNWWNHDNLKQIFDYKGLNIALMIESELIVSLLKFGHRIWIVEKIICKIKPDVIYYSNSKNSISRIPELFVNDYKFQIKHIISNIDEKNFRNENYTIGFDFMGKNLDIVFSRNKFFKIKNTIIFYGI
ncbi:hypothetical protein [Candidatus Nitrosarchaeum limnium]|uniref:Uncharacterized protein n=1 Tax=Candidatus Nitrosarchaeum limnium BG20 TaxID=859192 RepID=S2E1V7_9ARCH|nr:hypothetical protein [Candidatus Nitrosarchaeum limnium]EPA05320.1 hypothetical protein BG20_I0151 [Candidatus Nitrosarchaeum limnium BG20]